MSSEFYKKNFIQIILIFPERFSYRYIYYQNFLTKYFRKICPTTKFSRNTQDPLEIQIKNKLLYYEYHAFSKTRFYDRLCSSNLFLR